MVLAAVAPVRSFANRERRPPRAGRIRPAPPGRADRNNRVDLSPYYPVFGRRMVMIAYARRPGTRRKPPAGTVPEPSASPRATPQSLPRPRLVRLCPMKSHATAVTRHAPGIRLFDRTPASRKQRTASWARTAGAGPCAITMVGAQHIGRDLPALCPFCPSSAFLALCACGTALRAPERAPADLSTAQSTRSISVNCAIDRNMLEADRLLSVDAGDRRTCGARKTRRAAVSAIRRVVNGGGAGNRTRVLQYLTRTSPSAACICFSQPRRSRRQDADGLSHC